MPNEIKVNGPAPIGLHFLHEIAVAIVWELGGQSVDCHRCKTAFDSVGEFYLSSVIVTFGISLINLLRLLNKLSMVS